MHLPYLDCFPHLLIPYYCSASSARIAYIGLFPELFLWLNSVVLFIICIISFHVHHTVDVAMSRRLLDTIVSFILNGSHSICFVRLQQTFKLTRLPLEISFHWKKKNVSYCYERKTPSRFSLKLFVSIISEGICNLHTSHFQRRCNTIYTMFLFKTKKPTITIAMCYFGAYQVYGNSTKAVNSKRSGEKENVKEWQTLTVVAASQYNNFIIFLLDKQNQMPSWANFMRAKYE